MTSTEKSSRTSRKTRATTTAKNASKRSTPVRAIETRTTTKGRKGSATNSKTRPEETRSPGRRKTVVRTVTASVSTTATTKRKATARAATKRSPAARSSGKRGRSRGAPIDPEDLLGLSSEMLLRRWIDTRRHEWRDALVERHLPDVAEIARGLRARLPRSVDVDDLCNAGYGGLLRCLETFNPKKGRSFLSYLKTRVYGAMVDELRAMDWLPRLMRSRLARRDQLVERLRQEHGREPSDEELAEELGVSLEAYRRSYPPLGSNPSAGFVSGSEQDLDRLDASAVALGMRGLDEDAHPLTSMYHQELMGRVEELCNATEWKLVRLHYFQGLKLRDIARKLRLSPARICQIHGRVLQRLKERLREEALSI